MKLCFLHSNAIEDINSEKNGIVAEERRRHIAYRAARRPTFTESSSKILSELRYLSYEKLRDFDKETDWTRSQRLSMPLDLLCDYAKRIYQVNDEDF